MTGSVQKTIQQHLNTAAKELQAAHSLAVKTNPMAADLPVFISVAKMQKDVGELMQGVSKVRGL